MKEYTEVNPYTRRVQFYETDGMGIVHHSNYIRWFEEARVDFMEQIGFPYSRVSAMGIDFPVIEINCRYKGMSVFEECIVIKSEILSVTPTRLKIGYRVTESKSGILRTLGSSGHCFYSNELKRPVSLKRELPELYELFTAQLEQ